MVSFDVHHYVSGVVVVADFMGQKLNVTVNWIGSVTQAMKNAHADLTKRIDDAASAVALLLVKHLTNLTAVQISAKKNGVDYFLRDPNAQATDPDHLIFNNTAALEVSGIQTQTSSNTINARMAEKKKRLGKYGTPYGVVQATYIYVVEFSGPAARIDVV